MASRAVSRQGTTSHSDSDAPWPANGGQTYLVLAYDIRPDLSREFLSGTFVYITEVAFLKESPTEYPGQASQGQGKPTHKDEAMYRCAKTVIKTQTRHFASSDGANALTAGQLSFQPRGRPIPADTVLELGAIIHVLEEITIAVDPSIVPIQRMPRTLTRLRVPAGTSGMVTALGSREGSSRLPASTLRHATGRRYVVQFTVQWEVAEEQPCRYPLFHSAFCLPTREEMQRIRRLKELMPPHRGALPKVILHTAARRAATWMALEARRFCATVTVIYYVDYL